MCTDGPCTSSCDGNWYWRCIRLGQSCINRVFTHSVRRMSCVPLSKHQCIGKWPWLSNKCATKSEKNWSLIMYLLAICTWKWFRIRRPIFTYFVVFFKALLSNKEKSETKTQIHFTCVVLLLKILLLWEFLAGVNNDRIRVSWQPWIQLNTETKFLHTSRVCTTRIAKTVEKTEKLSRRWSGCQ